MVLWTYNVTKCFNRLSFIVEHKEVLTHFKAELIHKNFLRRIKKYIYLKNLLGRGLFFLGELRKELN